MKQRGAYFCIIVPVLSTFLTVIFIEIVLRTWFPIPYSIAANMYFKSDQYTGFKLKPLSHGWFQDRIIAKTNQNGHRDHEVFFQNQKDVYRIMVIGDSFTVGASVEEEEAYPQVLEKLFYEKKSKVEIINTGVGGWNPFQYANYYKYSGYKFKPDCILIGLFVGNDTYDKTTDESKLNVTAVMGMRISKKEDDNIIIKILNIIV